LFDGNRGGFVSSAITEPRVYTAKEVARLLRMSPERVRDLVASGELSSIRLGKHGWHRFRAEDVERLIAGGEESP
jgi:excisionase family DNA binding protein